MNDIPPINSAGQITNLVSPRPAPTRPATSDDESGDRLEISETGQILSNLAPASTIRADRVAQIRQAIADGTYETPEKIELTVDRLLDVLRASSVGA
jgi:negative regulator of flagellin synthesis FlgM